MSSNGEKKERPLTTDTVRLAALTRPPHIVRSFPYKQECRSRGQDAGWVEGGCCFLNLQLQTTLSYRQDALALLLGSYL